MAKSYTDDQRCRLLQAHDRGEGTLEQLAVRFHVSVSWAWKISAQRKSSGQMERIEQRRGSRSKVIYEVEQRLPRWVEEQRGLTLAKLQRKLETAAHLYVSTTRLWQVLRQMGLRPEKGRSTPANTVPHRTGDPSNVPLAHPDHPSGKAKLHA
jgi:transposase